MIASSLNFVSEEGCFDSVDFYCMVATVGSSQKFPFSLCSFLASKYIYSTVLPTDITTNIIL